MDVRVRPDGLARAGLELRGLAARLMDTRAALLGRTTGELPALGHEAAATARQATSAADHALTTLVRNTDELARAVRLLADVYGRVDETAVRSAR